MSYSFDIPSHLCSVSLGPRRTDPVFPDSLECLLL